MENAAGVQAGERPVHLPGLDELIQTVEGEIEDLESLREEIDSGVAAAVTERTSPLCPFFLMCSSNSFPAAGSASAEVMCNSPPWLRSSPRERRPA